VPKEPIRTAEAPAPAGAYSQAIATDELVFLAGQGPFRLDGSKVEGSFDDQARQTFANLAAVAEAAGSSLANAVRVGVFLRDMTNFPAMNEIYREFFSEPLPARTTIQSDLPDFEIEVDAILLRGE
jgi:2-iminobutanoate/2-iminopropanoate deaminase